jgi:tight adherence protein B
VTAAATTISLAGTPLAGLLLAAVAAYGTFLVYTAVAFHWRGMGAGPPVSGGPRPRPRAHEWLAQAGLHDTGLADLAGAALALAVIGAAGAFALFGGPAAAAAAGLFAAATPFAAARNRRRRRRAQAREAWPRLIQEIRLQVTGVGRSVPQAVFDVGRRAPVELRPAFHAGQREWLLGGDFGRAMSVLKSHLADATADTVCETLLVAHDLGGSNVGRRLEALAEDRIIDLQGRKDAFSRQAGARFARRFVVVVPLGMALVGLTIGSGRAAYATTTGQLLVVVAIGMVVACWAWAGLFMRLPDEQRVFYEER